MSKYGFPELYSRFLSKSNLKDQNKRIHFRAFKYNESKITGRKEVSCFETQGLNIEDIKTKIIKKNNITAQQKEPIAQANFDKKIVDKINLEIDCNYNPERHINLVGWEQCKSKEDEIAICTYLAENSFLIVY